MYKEGEQFNYSLELGLSDEPDYLSRSYAGQISRGFAEDTLVLTSGFSYMDDNVDSGVPGGPSLGILSKRTKEVMIGLYRMINPTSSVSLKPNLWSSGGIPERPLQTDWFNETLFPGDPVLERDVFISTLKTVLIKGTLLLLISKEKIFRKHKIYPWKLHTEFLRMTPI